MNTNYSPSDQSILTNVLTYTEILDIATLLVVLVCLWIRRGTWRYKWEQPKTVGLALIAAGAFLKAPPISWLIDRDVLHGLYLMVAHVLMLSGVAAFAYSAERKLRPDSTIRRWHITFVVFPLTLGVTVMLALFSFGANSNLDQLFQSPVGLTMVYWLVYDALIIYFLGLWAYALGYLIWDPPSRLTAGIYLLAVGFAIVGATSRALLVVANDRVPNAMFINVGYTATTLAILVFAIGAAKMWRCSQRIMKGQPHQCACRRGGQCIYLNTNEQTTLGTPVVRKITHP